MQALSCTHSVYVNGFVFDDLPLELVKQAARVGSEAGAAVCFDPGAKRFHSSCWSSCGDPLAVRGPTCCAWTHLLQVCQLRHAHLWPKEAAQPRAVV